MKGMMFSEFVEWVERTWSEDVADDMIEGTPLRSGGAYTAVGTYPHDELVALVVTLSGLVDRDVPSIVRHFGRDLFERLVRVHPDTLAQAPDAFTLLGRLEGHIHPEVRKLYPGAEVPSFDATPSDRSLDLVYRSPRGFADLAEGLIEGCSAWYDEPMTIHREELDDGSTRFHIVRRAL